MEPPYPVSIADDSTPSLGRVHKLVWYDEVPQYPMGSCRLHPIEAARTHEEVVRRHQMRHQ